MRTVNGKPLNECLDVLRAYKPKSKEREAGGGKKYMYYAFDEYVQRMDESFGNDHYHVEMSDFQLLSIATGQQMPTVKCCITIIDDNGDVVAKKSAYGGSEVTKAKETGLDYNFGNLPGNAGKDAFKAACEMFGIFGVHLYNKDTKNKEVKKEPEKEKVLTLLSQGPMEEVSEKDGKKTFKLKCREKVGRQVREALFEVLFYPNQYGSDAQKFNDFYGKVATKSLCFKALLKPCGMKQDIPQFVFKGFPASK